MDAETYRRGLVKKDPSPFYSPLQARLGMIQDFLASGENTEQYNNFNDQARPDRDWAQLALNVGANTSKLVGQAAQNAINNSLNVGPPGSQPNKPASKGKIKMPKPKKNLSAQALQNLFKRQ